MARIIGAFKQFFDDAGDPLIDGFLYFLESGSNIVEKDTFADINETIPNQNPLPLDGAGRCPNCFGTGAYNVISFTSDMVQIQQFDPVIAGLSEGAFALWDAVSVYSLGNIVIGPDGRYYRSITNNNQGQDPTANPDQWEKFYLIGDWNENLEYLTNDNVIYQGIFYRSRTDANVNNNPSTSPTFWEATGGAQMLGDAIVKAIFYNAQTIDEDITISSVQNGLSSGPITIATGRTVTIESGGNWSIV